MTLGPASITHSTAIGDSTVTDEKNVSQIFASGHCTDAATSYSFSMMSAMSSHSICRLVRAQRYGRWWVLKALSQEYLGVAMYEEMLRKEFEIAISLQHAGIVETVGYEEVAGLGHCIVMEWIDGETLHCVLDAAFSPCRVHGSLAGDSVAYTRAKRLDMLHQLLDAVEYIHSRQVVHRDIKPSNILVTCNGARVKLIDFSLSDTESFAVLKHSAGSIGYVSPEQQADGAQADVRNDIYSIGCVMRDMRLGWAVQPVVRRCLATIGHRPATVAELRRMLNRALWMPRMIVAAAVVVAACVLAPPAIRQLTAPPDGEAQIFIDNIQIDNIFYQIDNVQRHTLEVTGAIPDVYGRVIIPDHVMYDGERYTVHTIGQYALEDAGASDISIPATVEVIGQFALFGNHFKSIVFPESTYSLQRGALHSCQQLESIELGSNVGVIDLDAFTCCQRLRYVTLRTLQPPIFGTQNDIDLSRVTLRVPAEAVEIYRNSESWRVFGSIVACPF